MHQMNFPPIIHKSCAPNELLHVDVWGPSTVISCEGYKYYLSVVDDYSKYTWIYPLTLKSQVSSVLLNHITMAERQFDNKVKAIQTDMGGEFMVLHAKFKQMGIQIKHSCPHTHPQNGTIERKHQHITEVGLALLAHSKLPFKYWWDSFHTATYIINKLPFPTLQHVSPHQMLFNHPPDYSFLKTFGCACYPFLRPYNTSKLQFRSSKCVFLGYNSLHCGYRCLHPSRRVFISKTVTFDEQEFPYSSLFSNTSNPPSIHPSILTQIPEFPAAPTPTYSTSSSTASQPLIPHRSSTYSPLHPSDTETTQISSTTSFSTSGNTKTAHQNIVPHPTSSVHPMLTRSKVGCFKQKIYTASAPIAEPDNVK